MLAHNIATRHMLSRSSLVVVRPRICARHNFRAYLHSGQTPHRDAFIETSPEKGVKLLLLNRPKAKNAISMQLLKVTLSSNIHILLTDQ